MKKKFIIIVLTMLFSISLVTVVNASDNDLSNDIYVNSLQTNNTENLNVEDIQATEGSYLSVEEYITPKLVEVDSSDNEVLISNHINQYKVEAEAGEKRIVVNNSEDGTMYIGKNGALSKTKNSDTLNEIEIRDNTIVSTDEGIVSTLGGYEYTLYVYPTLENAYNHENGVTLSGGGYDARYIETESFENEYFAKVQISGLEGYVNLNNVQIIPSSLVQSQTHYERVGDNWIFYEAIDPLLSNSYNTYVIDDAPSWSTEGTEYYSYDNENFYENNIIDDAQTPKVDYNYFQNLPFRSTSDFTASDYKSFLKYKGHTDSKYYEDTQSFINAQELEAINSLLLFSMANHEGAYGTSNYSNRCNNFFGWGANDKNPDNACIEYGYNTANDGILAQAIHLSIFYGDVSDFRYYGTELGDKSHGMNVKYASDPNWGIGISGLMYETNEYLRGNELNKYRIYEIVNQEPIYTASTLGTKVKFSDGSTYNIVRNKVENDYYNGVAKPRVIVTEIGSKGFKIQIPTPVNISGNDTCTGTEAIKGSYPNYEGTTSTTAVEGSANWRCDYLDWKLQQKWYPNQDKNGNTTYKVINDVPAISPGISTLVDKISINGNNIAIGGYSVVSRKPTTQTSGVTQELYLKKQNSSDYYTLKLPSMKYSSLGNYSGYGIDGSKVVSLSSIPTGKYDLSIKTSYDGLSDINRMKTDLSRRTLATYSSSTKRLYEIIIYSTGTVALNIEPLSIGNQVYNVTIDHDKMHLSGYSFLRGLSNKYTKYVYQDLVFENATDSYKIGLKEIINTNITKSFGKNGVYNYDAYGIDWYRELPLDDIKPGTYTMKLQTSSNNVTLSKNATSEKDIKAYDTWGGYRYEVYKNGSDIMFRKTKI